MTMFTKSPTKLRLFNKSYKSVATFLLFLTTTFVEKLWQSLILYIFCGFYFNCTFLFLYLFMSNLSHLALIALVQLSLSLSLSLSLFLFFSPFLFLVFALTISFLTSDHASNSFSIISIMCSIFILLLTIRMLKSLSQYVVRFHFCLTFVSFHFLPLAIALIWFILFLSFSCLHSFSLAFCSLFFSVSLSVTLPIFLH